MGKQYDIGIPPLSSDRPGIGGMETDGFGVDIDFGLLERPPQPSSGVERDPMNKDRSNADETQEGENQ